MKISVCVPVYNVEQYIERCAYSLFNQTYDDVEYIFVDDGSTDSSISILKSVIEKFPQRKEQTKIITHPYNKGLSAARKTSILASTGDYISIVDSDDWIEHNMLEVMIKKAIEEDADITTCDLSHESDKGHLFIENSYSETPTGYPFDDVITERIGYTIWNKLYKRSLWLEHDCFSPEGLNYGEDRYSCMRLSFYANKIAHTGVTLYHYYKSNPNSYTAFHTRMHIESMARYWEDMDIFLEEHGLRKKYTDITAVQKISNKAALMLSVNSNSIRKEYANLFREEEKTYIPRLNGGYWVIEILIYNKLWILVSLFCIYAHNIYPIKQRLLQYFKGIHKPRNAS